MFDDAMFDDIGQALGTAGVLPCEAADYASADRVASTKVTLPLRSPARATPTPPIAPSTPARGCVRGRREFVTKTGRETQTTRFGVGVRATAAEKMGYGL